ncbi:radical SAM protein [Paenibacillus elgii]|uniref:radical SAM/SPASM domain-containing protein n=1 Tax=Paenibacillus elgii TaxID=189691 RepID=UPI002D7AAE4C|nr:radical SAM protein [Paenibacillus elgii]
MAIKPSYNTERTLLGEQLPLDTPYSVILDVSERCNFKCSYCFRAGKIDESWGFAAARSLMSPETFQRAARQLAEFPRKIKVVSLSGHGEPLANPRIVDMVRYLKELNVAEQIDMHTNASLLTQENAPRIARAGFTRIVVSLQGLDALSYERTCGVKINFDKFYNNLKLLYESKDSNLQIHIKIADVALGKENVEESKQKFYALFSGIADHVYVEKVVPIWDNVDISTDGTTNKFGDATGGTNYCSLVFYKMMVDPDGEIYPCTKLPPPMSLGNISDTTLPEAWYGRTRSEFLKEHLCLTRHKHKPCVGCFIPVNSITSHKDVIDPYKDAILERFKEISPDE